jgi:hypothetical protein
MGASTRHRRLRLAVGAAAGAVFLGGAAFAIALPAGSAEGDGSVPGNCAGDVVIAFGGDQEGRAPQLVASMDYPELGIPTSRAYSLTDALPAGAYELSAFTYDGFEGRSEWVVEPHERVRYELYDAADDLLVASGVTPDLADGVEEASWSGSLGVISWTGAPATTLVVHHLEPQPDDETYNKVDAVCVGLSVIPAVTTTTSTTVPVASEQTPSTTSTTLPVVATVEVLGTVQVPVASPAVAQVAQPSFTG